MIMGSCPKERPDNRYFIVMRQLIGISNNLNQIAKKANTLGFIDAPMIKKKRRRGANFTVILTGVTSTLNLWIFRQHWQAAKHWLNRRKYGDE